MRLFIIAAVPIAFLLYGHGLQAPFYLDDNTVLRSVLESDGLPGTRPLGYFSFYLSSLGVDAFGPLFHWKPSFYYRLGNLLIHILAATAVFGLARELTKRNSAAVGAGLLFLVHPVVSQPVMYVSQRFESLAALFMFLSVLAYFRFRSGDHKGWLAGAVGFGIAAALSKEIAVILPLWILLMELTFFGKLKWDKRFLILIPAGGCLAWPAWVAFRSSADTLTSIPWGQYVLTQGPVLLNYLKLCIYPSQLFLMYDFQLVTLSAWVLFEWLVVLALLATGIALIHRYPTIGFGILTFFVLMLPVTLLPLPDLFFEHRVYGAFGGLAIAAGSLLAQKAGVLRFGLIAALVAGFAVRTFERSAEWNEEIAFFEAHRAAFPNDAHALSYLALHYRASGQIRRSIETLGQAQANVDRFNAYYSRPGRLVVGLNLISAHMTMGDLEAAEEELGRILEVDPDEPAVRQVEGGFYLQTGRPEDAVEAFRKATELEPEQLPSWVGLQRAYALLGREEEALEAEERFREIQEVGAARNDARWFIPVRFRTHVIFGILLMFLVITFVCGKFVWSTARQRWFHG